MKAAKTHEAVTHIAAASGDDAVAVLSDFARDHKIDSAQFSASGAFARATIGWFDNERNDYSRIEVDQPCEVLSLLGGIANGEDGPRVHAQVVLGLSNGVTRGGHLLSGTVWPNLDIVVRETQAEPARSLRPRAVAMICGFLLILLGAWGALSPFVGPSFDFGVGADTMWQWSSARGWLEVAPGAVAAVGGLVMMISPSRLVVMLGGALAAIAGGWFIVGTSLADLLRIGSVGAPLGSRPGIQSLEWLALFYGLGATIVLVVAFVLGRLSVQGFGRAQLNPAVESVAATEPAAAPSLEEIRYRAGSNALIV